MSSAVFVALPHTCVFIVVVSILARIILVMDNRRIITRLRRNSTESVDDAAGAPSSHGTSVAKYGIPCPLLLLNDTDHEQNEIYRADSGENVDLRTPTKTSKKTLQTKKSSVKKAWTWEH